MAWLSNVTVACIVIIGVAPMITIVIGTGGITAMLPVHKLARVDC